jgi:sugar phosphate isomerase/epimerase
MESRPELIATYFTLAGNVRPLASDNSSPASLAERAEAAGRAGYTGLGFGYQEIVNQLERLGAAEINAILDHNGLVHRELEVLLDWFVDGERRAVSDRQRRDFLQAAAAIGACHIKVAGDMTGTAWPLEHLVEEFGRLCDEAAAVGTAISIELFPSSNLADLQTGRILVEGANRTNGGLLLDIWHMVRGEVSLQAIASLPRGIINHVELDDGALLPAADYLTDTISHRLAPGEGEFPCKAFVEAIAATGYRGLFGVEILSDDYRSLSAMEAAQRSYIATIGLFD